MNKSELSKRIEMLSNEEAVKKESLIADFEEVKRQLMPKVIVRRLVKTAFLKIKSILPGKRLLHVKA